MGFRWPEGFPRVRDEDWTVIPVDGLATKYDTVEAHGWYSNLDPTVEELLGILADGSVLIDYSGGTGILVDRLFAEASDRGFGVVNVDSSPKFLRLSLEKFRDDERVAFRLIRYLKEEGRLQRVDEVLEAPLVARGVDVIVSTNAIHLYGDLPGTFRSWARILRPGGHVHVQSGNVKLPDAGPGRWIIDDTVEAVHAAAAEIVLHEERFAAYRESLDDEASMTAHEALRRRVFIPPRPLDVYLGAFEDAGLEVARVEHRTIHVRTREWLDFLGVYHEGILGWVGGAEKVVGRPASPDAVRDRIELMRLAASRVFGGRDDFDAVWTYVTCLRRA